MEIALDDYGGFNIFITYAMYTYRNAIGDINPPTYTFWLDFSEENPTIGWTMISIIWFLWVINQVIVLIIMFNFLIAIIDKSYNDINDNAIVTEYAHKS